MTRVPTSETSRRLYVGLNGDADQRAAINLLIDGAHGVWLEKLAGWPEYMRPLEDSSRPDGLFLDWQQLRVDVDADDRAWAAFTDWAESRSGRNASDEEYEDHLADTVPRRPWHGASNSELVLLRLILELAPGGLLGYGPLRLDRSNRQAVLAAFDEVIGV